MQLWCRTCGCPGPAWRRSTASASTTRSRPGETAALIIPFGSAVCDTSEPATDDAYAVMTLVDVGELRVPITDGLQTLTRLHERDCTRRELEKAVTLGFTPHRPGRCSISAASRCCAAG